MSDAAASADTALAESLDGKVRLPPDGPETSPASSSSSGIRRSTERGRPARGPFSMLAPAGALVVPQWPDRPRSRSPSMSRRGSAGSSAGAAVERKGSGGEAAGAAQPQNGAVGVMERIRRVVSREDDGGGAPRTAAEEYHDVASILRAWKERRAEPTHELMEKTTAAAAFLAASDPRAREKLKGSAGLELLIAVMDAQVDSPVVQENGCNLVAMLVGDDRVMQERVAQCGGVEAVLRALKRHKTAVGVQERAISALRSMTLVPHNRLLISNLSGIEAVVGSMGLYLSEAAGVQIEGCTLLANLAFGSHVNKKTIGHIGGIDAIIQAMKVYMGDPMVQTRASLALRNIAWGSEENRALIGLSGGVDCLIHAMERHRTSVTVLEQSATALCNIVLGDENNQIVFDRCRGLEVLIHAMKLFQDDAVIQEHAIALINNRVLRGGPNLALFCSAGGVEALIESVTSCTWHDGVLENGSLALRYLLTSEENRIRVYRSGGIEKLVDALYAVSRRITRVNSM